MLSRVVVFSFAHGLFFAKSVQCNSHFETNLPGLICERGEGFRESPTTAFAKQAGTITRSTAIDPDIFGSTFLRFGMGLFHWQGRLIFLEISYCAGAGEGSEWP